ncbi:hypothetical protein FB561_6280 [Kribbella amoyensis]|uniref:Uncharacterized protein n=1 Tax=Kribbella amoyensis TaxID=996641 RepID=A0A561B7A2_9ACTN|nr:hypothetical protein [Kribbella amoyensis]TWD74846.1 hypothetical protein FB561_6280 [Kribbella amoyensis]
MAGPLSRLFLNKGREEEAIIEAPAFSITKVLAVAAPLVTTLVGVIADKVDWFKLDMRASHFTALAIGVLGLIAVAGSADVLARAIASRGKSTGSVISFATPLGAVRVTEAEDVPVAAVAVSAEQPPRFLCLHPDGALVWETEQDLRFTTAKVAS